MRNTGPSGAGFEEGRNQRQETQVASGSQSDQAHGFLPTASRGGCALLTP